MKYHQITQEERYIISYLRKQGLNKAEIAARTGYHRSTIGREFARNCNWQGIYRPSKAQAKTNGRRSRSRRNSHFSPAEMALVEEHLKKDWSPEQIAGRLALEGKLRISHETIYRHVWTEKAKGGELWKHLRCSHKKRRKRYRAYDSRGRLAGKRSIEERPERVNRREEMGHWEIDTVMGGGDKHCILTMVERRSGFTLIGKLVNRTQEVTQQRACWLMSKHPGWFQTITCDHGTEFHSYRKIEKRGGVLFYFAHPYHSWERGTNENTNGLIRQYLPKRQSMKEVTQWECTRIARKLNTRPRKRLGYLTPQEFYEKNE